MLVLRTPKGLSGPKIVHGEFVEGSFHSHQVPLPLAKTSDEELKQLQTWLASYKPEELFTKEGVPVDAVLSVIPVVNEKKLGQRKESFAACKPLLTPNWEDSCVPKGSQESCMKAVGRFLKEVVKEYIYHYPSLSMFTDAISQEPNHFSNFLP
jgi:xylulose-5-phosphate/fructose-6-phosphate phosphoketolase